LPVPLRHILLDRPVFLLLPGVRSWRSICLILLDCAKLLCWTSRIDMPDAS
jgi:hypothetical protein